MIRQTYSISRNGPALLKEEQLNAIDVSFETT